MTTPNNRPPERPDRQIRAILDNTTDIVFVKDTEGRYTMLSPAGLWLFNRPLEEILGKTDVTLHGGEIGAAMQAMDERIIEKGETIQYEAVALQDGNERYFVTTKFPYRDEEGRVRGVVGISHDITQYRRAEEALRESEHRYQDLFEGIDDPIYVHDEEANILEVNQAACQMLGYIRDELLKMKTTDIDEPEYAAGFKARLEQQMSQGKLSGVTGIHVTKDGRYIYVEVNSRRITYRGKPAVLAVARDISTRKATEEALRESQEHALELVSDLREYINRLEIIQRVDAELTQVLKFEYVLEIALDAAVRMSGADAGAIHLIEDNQLRVAQVIGNYPRSLIGARVPMDQGLIGRVLRTARAEFVEDVARDPDYLPNVADTQAQITIPLIAQDVIFGVLNVQTSKQGGFTMATFDFLRLLTARIASALENARLYKTSQDQLEELQDLYQQVKGLEQLKTQMIRIAAHDLRNPLGVISGYLEMWQMLLPEQFHGQIRASRQAVERIDKISRDILTLERIQASGRDIQMERAELGHLVADAYEDHRTQAAEKSLVYKLNLPSKPVLIDCNRVLLHETITNLINNAIKYTPDNGEVRLDIRAEGGLAILEVTDTGFGIPEDQQAGLFQPFYRAKTDETRFIKGTGLGLHLVKTIVEGHRGQIRFHSSYGKGSTFGFQLPLMKKSRSPRKAQQARRKTGIARTRS